MKRVSTAGALLLGTTTSSLSSIGGQNSQRKSCRFLSDMPVAGGQKTAHFRQARWLRSEKPGSASRKMLRISLEE